MITATLIAALCGQEVKKASGSGDAKKSDKTAKSKEDKK